MSKIFVKQTKLTLRLDPEADVSDVTAAKIRYKKPNKTIGEFNASIPLPGTGIVEYAIQSANELDIPGTWKFWVHLTYTNGQTIEGDPSEITIHPSGG